MSWVKCNDSNGKVPPCVCSSGIGRGFAGWTDADMKTLHYIFCTKNQKYWLKDADRPCADYIVTPPD